MRRRALACFGAYLVIARWPEGAVGNLMDTVCGQRVESGRSKVFFGHSRSVK
jgi:hypothetical protein